MKKILSPLCLVLLVASPVFADWDAQLEAEEAAKRAASQRQSAIQQQRAEQMKQEAIAKYHAEDMARKRKELGVAAEGKSDAEVEQLYQKRAREHMVEATTALQDAQRAMLKSKPAMEQKVDMKELDTNTKAATGRSLADLSKMSDAELEALEKEMEQRYGQ